MIYDDLGIDVIFMCAYIYIYLYTQYIDTRRIFQVAVTSDFIVEIGWNRVPDL